jgi:hypothetical protein
VLVLNDPALGPSRPPRMSEGFGGGYSPAQAGAGRISQVPGSAGAHYGQAGRLFNNSGGGGDGGGGGGGDDGVARRLALEAGAYTRPLLSST